MKYLLPLLAWLTWVMIPSSLFAESPQIQRTRPAAIAPGQSVDVQLFGDHLNAVTDVWTSFPARWELSSGIEKNGTDAKQVTYRFTVPRDVQVGIGVLRVATGEGASNLKLLMLDDIPSVNETGGNHEAESAQQIELPAGVEGICDSVQSDYFQFDVKAGQELSVEVVAQRIGSNLDPVVALLDSEGRELVKVDDDLSVGADSRFSWRCPTDGRYVLRLQDVQHRGGDGYYYRLRVGRFPLASVAFPSGGTSGSVSTFRILGPAVDGIDPVSVLLPDASRQEAVSLGVRFPEGHGSGFVTVISGSGQEMEETEPNDEPESATVITLPCVINGRFERVGDRDYYQFDAVKNQRMFFRGRTREFGSISDLFIRLYKAGGGMLKEVEDSGPNEGVFEFTFPEDGTYRLMVEDLLRGGGLGHVYRIDVESSDPGFSLSTEVERHNVPRGGTFVAKVTAARRHYNGPIELSVTGIGDDLVLVNHTIAKEKNEVEMKVTMPPHYEPGRIMLAQLVGKAKIGDRDVVVTASTLPAIRKAVPNTPFPPCSLDQLVAVAVSPEFPPFFELSIDSEKVYFPQRLGSSTYRVKLKRLNDNFKDPISVAVEGLPEGFSAEVKPVDKGQAEYEVIQKGPESLDEGVHEIRIVGTGTFQNQTKKVVLDKVPLHVIKPLMVSVSVNGPIKRGGKQTAKIQLARFGDEPKPVTVRWRFGPVGLSGPLQMTIPGDKNEIEVELSAAVDAPEGKFNTLVAVAATNVKNHDVVVTSAPASVEVQP